MPIGDGSIARAIGKGLKEKFPIGGAILETLGPEVVKAIQGPNQIVDVEALAGKLEKVAKQEPEIQNNLGVEKWWQSGTTLGMGGALLTSLGALWGTIKLGNYDPEVIAPLLATVLASVFGLWRRWAPNLVPLFSRRQ